MSKTLMPGISIRKKSAELQKSASKHYFVGPALPWLVILSREISKVCFLVKLKGLDNYAASSIALWVCLSVVFSIILALISDKDCRRRTLILTLSGSVAGLVLLMAAANSGNILVYLLAIGVDGVLGAATIPIARAAYCEVWEANTRTYKGKDKLITDTVIAQAFAWILLALNEKIFEEWAVLISLGANFLFLIATIFFFRDRRDEDSRVMHGQIKDLGRKYLHGYAVRLLLSFFILCVAFQFVGYLPITFAALKEIRGEFLLVEGFGVFIGCVVARFAYTYTRRFKSSYQSLLSFTLVLFLTFFIPWLRMHFMGVPIFNGITLLSFASVGGAVLSLTFGYFSHKALPHETGVLYAALEGIMVLAEGVTALFFFLGGPALISSKICISCILPVLLIGLGLLLIIKKEGHQAMPEAV